MQIMRQIRIFFMFKLILLMLNSWLWWFFVDFGVITLFLSLCIRKSQNKQFVKRQYGRFWPQMTEITPEEKVLLLRINAIIS